MNWGIEAQNSWTWLQWMREVVSESENAHPCSILRDLIRGLGDWNEANASDRYALGDPIRPVQPSEFFDYAASVMSRAAKAAISEALNQAIEAGVDDPKSWPSRPSTADQQWATSQHVITTVLQAWITLWRDLAALRDKVSGTSPEQVREKWTALADQAAQTITGASVDQAAQTITGASVAALAQRR